MKQYLGLMLALGVGWCLGKTGDFGFPKLAHGQQPAIQKPVAIDTRVEAVDLVTTLYLHQTYLNIGLLADCRAEGVYEEKQVGQLLASIVQPLDIVDQQLQGVAKLTTTRAERDRLEKMQKVIPALRRQGQELQKFWDTEKVDHAKRYEASRKEAWQNLAMLLGLNAGGEKKK